MATLGLLYSEPRTSGPAAAQKLPPYRSVGDLAANDPAAWDEHLNDVA